jgi:EAL domain-containing protein (putative c-di-GMP-specific phosphodiesterase class I)
VDIPITHWAVASPIIRMARRGELLRAAPKQRYALDNRIACGNGQRRSRRSGFPITDLRGKARQLHLHYQPKIDLTTGHCCGAEALLRWTHPDLGPIPPGEFIPLTERTALMRPLTEWVLAAAFHQVAEWRRDGFLIPISVNISMLTSARGISPCRAAGLIRRPAPLDRCEITEALMIIRPKCPPSGNLRPGI